MSFYLIWVLSISLPIQQEVDINELIQNQQYQKAILVIEAMDSTEQDLYLDKKAFCAYQLGLFPSAKQSYLRILKQDTFDTKANLYLSQIFEAELDIPKAILHASNLLKTDSTNSNTYKRLGRLYNKAHLKRLAKQYFERSLDYNPTDIATLLELGDLANAEKDWEMADRYTDRVLKIDSTNVRGILSKARSRYGQKDYGEVVKYMEKTRGRLDLTPYYQKILGYSYLQIDSLDQSIHTLENLLYREQAEHTYYYLAMAYGKKEEWEKSTYFYELATEAGISKNIENYYAAMAVAQKEQTNWNKAFDCYDEAFYFSQDPIHLLRKAQLAEWYYEDKSIALRQYQKCLNLETLEEGNKNYAIQRVKALKEYLHQIKK